MAATILYFKVTGDDDDGEYIKRDKQLVRLFYFVFVLL